ncbi:hypothetical protein CVU82_03280 [Candidatus Falkowbacteria bacterium HGW-Falkowbacteria-1]|jgi:hypothetical protein|uniref:Uncharacterized protein n=1 Tax=Candidatus Falkowbacteria bacterium HGW-Falkowbacteria-1 TaxID=2013768 RepID=A0A2N2E8Q2_9BACT|nr:MAG: hypothetical protein CVU82_03280 [Candidatus Falkowbacteria bacterium HGW-Falkowbacteria-1]
MITIFVFLFLILSLSSLFLSKEKNRIFFISLIRRIGVKRVRSGFSFLKFLLTALFVSWPCFFWLLYYYKIGDVPSMTQEDLEVFPSLSFLKYSISRWLDPFLWVILIFLYLVLDVFIDKYKFIGDNLNRLFLILIFIVCVLIFLCGSIYALFSFILFFFVYFIVVLIILGLKLFKGKNFLRFHL